jgi:hypothetical protein
MPQGFCLGFLFGSAGCSAFGFHGLESERFLRLVNKLEILVLVVLSLDSQVFPDVDRGRY